MTTTRRRARVLLLATVAIGGASQAGEGGLAVPSYTVDGGGGRSSGAGYEVVGSIGQVDAEPLHPASGGNFAVVGGFIPGAITTASPGDALFADGFED